MPDKIDSLEEREKEAMQALAAELRDHSKLADSAINLCGSSRGAMPPRRASEISKSCKVAMALLVRLSNDLRAVRILADKGYALQAVSLAASIYEVAYTVAYIGSDENLAEEWIAHDEPTKPFRVVRLLTEQGLTKLSHPNVKQQTGIEYRVYRQLCQAKHANPVLQRFHGIRVRHEEKEFVLFNGPDTSENAIQAAWFALEHAAALVAIVATSSFISCHVPPNKRPELQAKLQAIGKKRKQLEARAQERWGTQDPFPGRWRI